MHGSARRRPPAAAVRSWPSSGATSSPSSAGALALIHHPHGRGLACGALGGLVMPGPGASAVRVCWRSGQRRPRSRARRSQRARRRVYGPHARPRDPAQTVRGRGLILVSTSPIVTDTDRCAPLSRLPAAALLGRFEDWQNGGQRFCQRAAERAAGDQEVRETGGRGRNTCRPAIWPVGDLRRETSR